MTDECFNEIAQGHEVQWRERLLMWLVKRLPPEEREVSLEMLMAGLSQARNEGIGDALDVVGRIAVQSSGEHRRVLDIVGGALRTLRGLNEADGV